MELWQTYFNAALHNDWQVNYLMPSYESYINSEELASQFYLFAQNEANSTSLYLQASKVNSTPAWDYYSSLWLRDEIKHSEAFYKISKYVMPTNLKENLDFSWHHCFKNKHQDLYQELLTTEVHVWAALALDEWNTHREYLLLAREMEFLGLKNLILKIAADESRHYAFAVLALKSYDPDQVKNVLNTLNSQALTIWAKDLRFLFDHDKPDYEQAMQAIARTLRC